MTAVAREQLCGHVASPETRGHEIVEEALSGSPCESYMTRISSPVV
jgi:hypothetical protein